MKFEKFKRPLIKGAEGEKPFENREEKPLIYYWMSSCVYRLQGARVGREEETRNRKTRDYGAAGIDPRTRVTLTRTAIASSATNTTNTITTTTTATLAPLPTSVFRQRIAISDRVMCPNSFIYVRGSILFAARTTQ